MNNLNNFILVGLHIFLLGNAGNNVFSNFQAEDVAKAPVFFRLAQAANIIFSVCAARIARRMGPLGKPGDDLDGYALLAFMSGSVYCGLTGLGTLGGDADWWDEVRDTDSFRYMRSSVVIPLQALLATTLAQELTHAAETLIWLAQAFRPRNTVPVKKAN